MKSVLITILLLPFALARVTGTSGNNLRSLQSANSRPCNSKIATISSDEILAFGDLFLRSVFEPAGLAGAVDGAKAVLLESVQYNLTVHKVCGSCDEVYKYTDPAGLSSFDSFCGDGTHGQDARHSALLFTPMDGESDGIAPGAITSFVHMHSLLTSLSDCPTEVWPSSLALALQDTIASNDFVNFVSLFQNYFAGLVVASSGAAAIFPDYIGYGESTTFSRSSLTTSYAQAAVTSYAAAGSYIEGQSRGCSILEPKGSMLGLSEGGFAVIPAAEALSDFVEVQQVDSAGGPLNTFLQLAFAVDTFDNNQVAFTKNNFVFPVAVPYVAFLHSNDVVGYANSGVDEQRLLSPDFQDPSDITTDAFRWYRGPDALSFEEIISIAPADSRLTLNAEFTSLAREATAREVVDRCPQDLVKVGVTDLLCDALDQGNLWKKIEQTTLPLQLCFSSDDTVTSIGHFPDFLFDNPSVQEYESPVAELTPTGDHLQTLILCSNSAIFSLQAFPREITALNEAKHPMCFRRYDGEDGKDNNATDLLSRKNLIYLIGGVGVLTFLVFGWCCFCRRNK